jgi:alcohol dehydrogenase (NADP+)
MISAFGYAARHAGDRLTPFRFERREPRPKDVVIKVLWCGICHSDVNMVDNEWGFSLFPMVPGHEIVGRVTQVGRDVTKLYPGDMAAVGCMTDSCRVCAHCEAGLEQYCDAIATPSFSTYERGTEQLVFGGFSDCYVVDERFALKVPAALDPARAAPLLCAGITTYSPLRRWKIGDGMRVGVVGIGGLGHLALKLASKMGAEVVAITSSPEKRAAAANLGAQKAVLASDTNEMRASAGSFDFVLDTVSGQHEIDPLLDLLSTDGTLCMLGVLPKPQAFSSMVLESKRRRIAGSSMGGLPETQEMLEFCGAHDIGAEVEIVSIQQVNEAFARLRRNDVRYRFVIDMSSLDASMDAQKGSA